MGNDCEKKLKFMFAGAKKLIRMRTFDHSGVWSFLGMLHKMLFISKRSIDLIFAFCFNVF